MHHTLRAVRTSGAALILTLGLAGAVRAQVTVSPAVTFTGGLYHYDYSISNASANDVFLVDISVPKNMPFVVQNLHAPAGFQSQFDSVLGLVSFLEDTSVFTATPQNGFVFDSPLPSGRSQFAATFITPAGQTGVTTGPTGAPSTPEPGAAAVMAALSLSGLVAVRRRKWARK